MNGPVVSSVRLDKWLWAVRLYKTRTLAADACRSGSVTVNGQIAKASRDVHVGETIAARFEAMTRTVRVLELLERRVGAAAVKRYLDDLTPPEEIAKRISAPVPPPLLRPAGAGRPTKRDRRVLGKVMGWND